MPAGSSTCLVSRSPRLGRRPLTRTQRLGRRFPAASIPGRAGPPQATEGAHHQLAIRPADKDVTRAAAGPPGDDLNRLAALVVKRWRLTRWLRVSRGWPVAFAGRRTGRLSDLHTLDPSGFFQTAVDRHSHSPAAVVSFADIEHLAVTHVRRGSRPCCCPSPSTERSRAAAPGQRQPSVPAGRPASAARARGDVPLIGPHGPRHTAAGSRSSRFQSGLATAIPRRKRLQRHRWSSCV
jgi:hypothetical protein